MNQLIPVLGIKRIIILGALIAINVLLAAVIYGYLQPHNATLLTQSQTLTSQLSSKRADTQKLTNEYQTIEDQKVFFSNLQAAGFFGDQNRTLVRTRIADIQKFTNVLSAKYSVSAAQIEHNQAVDDAGYVLLDSPVSIDIDAFDDTDVLTFIYCLENAFPGHVSVNAVALTREQDIAEQTLKQIGGGMAVALVKAKIDFSWRTMAPAKQITPGAAAPPKS